MFTSLFVKKKISHKEIAQKFVHHTLQTIDDTYSDFLDAIFYDPELTEHPPLDYKDPRKFSLIIIAGNMKFFEIKWIQVGSQNRPQFDQKTESNMDGLLALFFLGF